MGVRLATAEINLKAQTNVSNSMFDGSVATAPVGGQLIRKNLSNGIGRDQINRAWQKKNISIADGGFRLINLVNLANTDIGAGNGLDALGQSWDLEEMVLLVIKNHRGPGILEVQASVPAAAAIVWIPGGYASNANQGGIREGGSRIWFEPHELGLDVGASSAVIRLSAAAGQGNVEEAHIIMFGRNDDDESSSSSASSLSSFSSSSSSS